MNNLVIAKPADSLTKNWRYDGRKNGDILVLRVK